MSECQCVHVGARACVSVCVCVCGGGGGCPSVCVNVYYIIHDV